MVHYIGIRHRVKRTANDEARPTQIAIIGEGLSNFPVQFELKDDQEELDFIQGCLPTIYRPWQATDQISDFRPWHIKYKDGEPISVPCAYTGLTSGDQVAMVLGGSGDRLAFAMSRVEGVSVLRIPASRLKEERERQQQDKDQDAAILAGMLVIGGDGLYPVTARDRNLISLRQAWENRQEALRARIGCQQRLRQRFIGSIFCSSNGGYPEGGLEMQYQSLEANDQVLAALQAEEEERAKELERLIRDNHVYQHIFQPIKGVGPMIAARLIISIGDIRRFPSKAKLKAYLGAHVLGEEEKDRQFPRRRRGQQANWSSEGRQALYLLTEQFNRRPDSEWGQKLRANKERIAASHPDESKGHIHNMARWRTASRFVEWLWREWTRLESNI